MLRDVKRRLLQRIKCGFQVQQVLLGGKLQDGGRAQFDEALALCNALAFLLIDQQSVGAKFDRQCDCLRFAGIKSRSARNWCRWRVNTQPRWRRRRPLFYNGWRSRMLKLL